MTKFSIFACLLFVSVARADILFLDINNASEEVNAAIRAGQERVPPEKVWVIPEKSVENRKEHDVASAAAEKAAAALVAGCPPGSNSPKCPALNKAWDEASENLVKALGKDPLSSKSIAAELKKLEAQGVKLSSVVISGHDGNGKFSGAYGAMKAQALEDAFASVPKLTEGVRSVCLWGCYTTTLGSIDGHWKPIFPNVGVFAGFDGRGPSKIREKNWTYLHDFLTVDKDLIKARDKSELVSIAKKIGGFNDFASSICTNEFMVTPYGSRNVADIRKDCAIDAKTKDLFAEFQCYMEAKEPRCANPPVKVDDNPSASCEGHPPKDSRCQPLRRLLTYLEQHDCAAYWSELKQEIKIPTSQEVQQLLFYNNLRLNLRTLHRKDLAKIDEGLREIGAPADLTLSDADQLSRGQLLQRLGAIQSFLDQPQFKVTNHPKAVLRDWLRGAVTEVDGIMGTMVKTPIGWYDPSTNPSMSLKAAVSESRKKEYAVDIELLKVKKQFPDDPKTSRSPKTAELDQAKKEYSNAFQACQQAQSPAQKAAALELSQQAGRKVTALENEVKRDGAQQVVGRLQAEIQRKSSSGWASPEEEKAYRQYFESLKAR